MRVRILVMVAIAALGATACGSSSKTADAPSGTTTPAGSNSSVTTTPVGSDSSSGDTTTTASSSDKGGGGGGAFCDLLAKESNAFDAQDVLTSKSPQEIKAFYADVESKLDDTVSKAPDAVKGDLSTVNDAIKLLVGELDKVDYDFTKLTPDSLQGLSNPKFEAASQHITTYLTQTCHITPTT